jgi:hypothetical protein
VFSVLWSEHCGYKHSARLLRKLPSHGERVLLNVGSNLRPRIPQVTEFECEPSLNDGPRRSERPALTRPGPSTTVEPVGCVGKMAKSDTSAREHQSNW